VSRTEGRGLSLFAFAKNDDGADTLSSASVLKNLDPPPVGPISPLQICMQKCRSTWRRNDVDHYAVATHALKTCV